MKKKTIILIIVIALLILLVPIPMHLKDGGTVEYKALLYKVSKVHKINFYSPTGYDEGIKIEILGMQVYNNVTSNVEPVEAYNVKNVSIAIKEDSLTNTSATIIIEDTNKNKHTYDRWYKIEKRENNEWKEVNKVNNNYGYEEEELVVGEDNKLTINVNWEELYGELETGKYRLIKKVDNKLFSGIAVEFEIK